MKVRDAMTPDVQIANPGQSIRDAARIMAAMEAGALPVGDDDRLVGMITDRDIAVRAVAQGLGPDTKIRDVMSADVKYCYEDDDLDEVARNMTGIKAHRLPVLDRAERLVGIVSLGDTALVDRPDPAGGAGDMSAPGGPHFQTGDRQGAARTALTRAEVLAALGPVDDIVVAEIIAMGATAEELTQASAADDVIAGSKPLPSDRVGRLIQILDKMEDDQEALLASSG